MAPLKARSAAATRARSSTGWPLTALLVGYPLWWVLGFGPLSVFVLSVPLAWHLLRRRRLVLPRGIGLYLAFLVFVAASVLMLGVEAPGTGASDPLGQAIAYTFDAASYLCALVVVLYLVNVSEAELSTAKVVRALACLFVATVAGGWLGLAAPDLDFTSPFEAALPGSLRSNEYVQALVHPGSAQVVNEISAVEPGSSPRPKAPFEFTNQWAANFSLLLPFFVLAWRSAQRPAVRLGGWLVLAAAVPPALLSLNRGLWIALVVAAVLGIVHALRTRRLAIATSGALAICLGAGAFALSPLLPAVTDRSVPLESDAPRVVRVLTDRVGSLNPGTLADHEGRFFIHAAAINGALRSPLLGWGGARRSSAASSGIARGRSHHCPECGAPPIGTHGTAWQVAYSQGFVALALLLGFLLSALVRSLWRRSDLHAAVSVAVALFLLESIYYGQLPTSLFIAMAAIGLAWRARAISDSASSAQV